MQEMMRIELFPKLQSLKKATIVGCLATIFYAMADLNFNLPDNLHVLNKDSRIQLALDAYWKSQAQTDIPNGRQKLSLHAAAKLFHVPCSTLTDRFNGVQTCRQAHEHQQNLTVVQKDILVQWAKSLGRRGVPLSLESLCEYASHICGFEVGSSWSQRFLDRHPEVKTRFMQSMEKCRATAVNHANVQGKFYTLYYHININQAIYLCIILRVLQHL
jgi:hypothetical protein